MQALQTVSLIFTVGFFICVGLYIYFMSRRMRKNAPVDFQLWLLVALGLLFNIGAQLTEMAAGHTQWSSIQWNVLITSVFVVYAVWRVAKIKKQPSQGSNNAKQPVRDKRQPDKTGKPSTRNNKGTADSNKQKGKSNQMTAKKANQTPARKNVQPSEINSKKKSNRPKK